jgi:hypothetical protein
MQIDFTGVISSLEEMANELIASIPNVVLGLILFVVFYYLAGGVRWVVRRFIQRSGLSDSASLALGRRQRVGDGPAGLAGCPGDRPALLQCR